MQFLQVKVCDWQQALKQAPKPCSQRQGMSALASSQAVKLPHHTAPLLMPTLQTTLRMVGESGSPLLKTAAEACRAALERQAEYEGRNDDLEEVLKRLGVVESSVTDSAPQPARREGMTSHLLQLP